MCLCKCVQKGGFHVSSTVTVKTTAIHVSPSARVGVASSEEAENRKMAFCYPLIFNLFQRRCKAERIGVLLFAVSR